jgi:two-component system response regulator AtoC
MPESRSVAWSEPAATGTGTGTPSYTASTLVRARRGSAEEEQSIIEALERSGGNQTQAARLLGISRRTLVNRLNDYKHVFRPRKDRKS